ncbi:MAG: 50S ribosomal protein L5 [Fibrobacteres bacterium]|nr:50S ribosomal protein L5 [Fibrobacterota bacterium]
MSLLKQKYFEVSAPALKEQFGLKNVMQVPRLQKIVLNMGVGEATQNPKLVEEAAKTLAAITGQKAIVTRAKKAISNFKLRENQAIGAKVTLHGNRMYEFIERLIHISLPRVRDFRGVSRKGFDGRGNYTLGIKEQIIFLEIDFDKVETILGMNITFVTSAPNDEQAYALLEGLGMPFRKN